MDRGDAELARLARSARTFQETLGQSGTAPRQALQRYGTLLGPGALGVAAGLSQGETPSEQTMAALGLGAAGLLAPSALARAYQNPAMRRYILQGAGSPMARRALMGPTARGMMTYGPSAGLLLPEDEE
jgi:hypothetical protein